MELCLYVVLSISRLRVAIFRIISRSCRLKPRATLQCCPVNQELASIPSVNDVHALSFALRSGTQPQDHIYFSGASLDSETTFASCASLRLLLHLRDFKQAVNSGYQEDGLLIRLESLHDGVVATLFDERTLGI